MPEREIIFNSATYALSHLRHSMFRSLTTITTLTIITAFILLTTSLFFGLLNETEGRDEKAGLLEGRVPGSISMFEEFNLQQDLSDEAKSALINYLIVTSTLVLLVAFFIMYNTMSIAVQERKREIGILRSVGFSRSEVMKIFLTEGGVIGSISFLFALFLGTPLIVNLAAYLIERGDRGFFFVQPSIPLQLIALILGINIILTMTATYLAAQKTLREPPVNIMRAGY